MSEILNRFFEESANRELPARPDMEMVDSRTLGPATLGETFVRGLMQGLLDYKLSLKILKVSIIPSQGMKKQPQLI